MKKYKETLTSDRIGGGIQYNRELWIDELKVFAIFAVIMIHVSTQYWTTIDVNNSKWVIITFYNCMSRWAVPVLVMVTGTLLGSPKKKLTQRKLKEKLLHIICFFVFWSVVYAILGIVPDVIRGTEVQIDEIVSRIIKGHFHLWYCYMLMGLYLISPFLQKIIEDEKLLKYFVFLSIVVTFGISQIVELQNLSLLHTVFQEFEWHFTLGYASYFMLGYFLADCDMSDRTQKILYTTGLLCMTITVLITVQGSRIKGEAWGLIHYFQPNVMLISVSIFVFFKNRKKRKNINLGKKYSQVLGWLSSNTLGVFAIHVLWRDVLAKVGIISLTGTPVIMVPLLTCIIAVFSYVSVWVIRKIPYLRYYIV